MPNLLGKEARKKRFLEDATLDTIAINMETARINSESLDSSRSALANLHAASDLAASSLQTLASQSERLDSIENSMNRIEGQVHVADEKAREIKRLQRLFIFPNLKTLFRKKKAKEETNEETEESTPEPSSNSNTSTNSKRLLTTASKLTSQQQLKQQQQQARQTSDSTLSSPLSPTTESLDFLDEDDLQTELEINQNLNSISKGLSLLKEASMAMGEEIDLQTMRISAMGNVGERASAAVGAASKKLDDVLVGTKNAKKGSSSSSTVANMAVRAVAGKTVARALRR
ncbi:hypothetical protein HDU97_006870 [Phlyctochytrium planicorne]|nr:hypothetical protein HDU97_006870 [Phlyctochytrium planicorne]